MHTTLLLILVTGALFLVNTGLKAQKALRGVQNWPGYRVLFTTRYILGTLLPFGSAGYLYREAFRIWKDKHGEFAEYGIDIISGLVVFPSPSVVVLVADATAIKEITTQRALFPKPLELYNVISFYGANIVASEGDKWKRYKKISAPAFSEPNNRMVWDETVRIMSDLFDVWGLEQEISVEHATSITLPLTLFIIGSAGFGQQMTWKEERVVPQGHRMSFKEALHILSTDIVLKVIAPGWLLNHGPIRLRKVGIAYHELKVYMTEMIRARKGFESKQERRHDLFSNLLEANDEDAEVTLSDSELLGNIFVFLLAGHETSAHTLCFAFGLLALYQDEQETAYQHIQKVMINKRAPKYEDAQSLAYCQAVLYETLRLYPPVPLIPKVAAEDTVLSTVNTAGETVTVPIPAGVGIGIHTPALHYNPRYWDDPYSFKPSRFLGDWPRDAFVPFSEGARSCLGRRFFETEAVVILAMLVSRYKIEVKAEPQFASETFEQRKERVLKARPGVTLTEAFKVWKDKHSEFAEHGVDIISSLVVFPYPNVVMMVADASAVKEITAHRSLFPKPLQPYKTIDVFGANIVGSEGEQWKRHKKISAPAFSEIAHFIIGSAGFGQRISWEEEQVIPPGHQMSFKEALHILSTDAILKAITPDWLLKYGPTRLRRVGKAFKEMKTYMTEMVQHRKSWHAEERHHDLFSNLLKANDEDADITLSDSELLGNIFVFLLAGHETTAHTLCFSLALLALYQDEQTKMYQNIQKVMAHKQVPMPPSLAYYQAVFYETLRLFPPLPVIQKLAAEDTVLSTVNAAGETVTVPIPAGAGIGIHTPGLHYNPRYWDDPYTFKPSRFLGEWPRDAFVPFSEGARSCLGRRFSETEATVILAMLVSRYRIEVKEEAQFSGETFEQRKERILKARPGLTLTPVKVPLVFKDVEGSETFMDIVP
ncbi:cytochrome P450 [Irpex lacteus]|nr:cytochrome P450 [Irpex lacteus]